MSWNNSGRVPTNLELSGNFVNPEKSVYGTVEHKDLHLRHGLLLVAVEHIGIE